MTTMQESNRSPHQVRITRGSPSNSSSNKSSSQLTTAHLVGGSGSSSSTRKRVHPNYLNIDDAVPPNKKINIPTKEEKACLLKEREMLYRKLAEEKRAPYYLTSQPVFPLLPLSSQFTTTITPNIYSLIQQQQQQQQQHPQHISSPPQVIPNNFIMSPSVPVNLSHVKLGPTTSLNTSTTLTANSSVNTSSLVGNTAGITGLPTPGGSSVGTPPNPPYQSQLYPTSILKFPFSPPTPSSFGLLSPWSMSNRSLGMNSSASTPGAPLSNEEIHATITDPSGMLQCLTTSGSSSENATTNVLATSTPARNSEPEIRTSPGSRILSSKEVPSQLPMHGQIQLGSISSSGSPQSVIMTGLGSWPANSAGGAVPSPATLYQSTAQTQLKSLQAYTSLASIRSPLGLSPYSPSNHIYSPYPGSVSSCPSVSSSSGCSSSSENQDNQAVSHKTYVLSEYHVGPHRMISEKDVDTQSEDTTNSGRNSPTELTAEECGTGTILPSDVAHRLSSEQYPSSVADLGEHQAVNPNAATKAHPLPSSGKKRRHSKQSGVRSGSPYPFSVESMGSSASPINTQQGYGASCHLIDRPSSGVSSMSSSLSSRDSTPELEDMKHDSLSQSSQGSDVFCLVPGRLSLLSSTQKYKVMVDEVRRRLGHPECLNASVLGGILRRAKSKNGGTMLRQKLHEIGVSLPPGRRKQTEISLLTSLVESEALHLASDFHRLCDNLFPHIELAQIIARQHTGTPEAQHRVSMVKATQLIVSELQQMIEAAGGPSNLRPSDPSNHYPGLTNFSLLTHSFGNPVINTCLGVLQTYLQELLCYYEGRRPIHLPERRYSTFENKLPQPSGAMGTAMGPESVPAPHGGNPPQQNTVPLSNGVQQNPLLYATRHYPGGGGRREGEEQENVSNGSSEVDVTVEVTLKEEPVDSPNAYTM